MLLLIIHENVFHENSALSSASSTGAWEDVEGAGERT